MLLFTLDILGFYLTIRPVDRRFLGKEQFNLPEKNTLRTNANILLVVGMHRSGTSFVANWLDKCGLDLGENLIPGDFSNPAGHYEDQSLSHFQRRILQDNGLDYLVTDETITIDKKFYAEAEALLSKQPHDREMWGWKDPRTTLLLDFWQDILPEIHLILVYRPPHHVVDSLLRREAERYLRNLKGYHPRRFIRRMLVRAQYSFANILKVRKLAHVWQRYNQDALAFVEQHPDRALVISVDDVLARGDDLVSHMNDHWGFSLESINVDDIYDAKLLNTKPMVLKQKLVQLAVPTVQATYDRLQVARDRTFAELDG